MKLPIYLYGAQVLSEPAKEADLKDADNLTALIADMKETLQTADGCGLAAPQVGVGLKILIVDGDVVADTYSYLKGFKRTMINPVVTAQSEETVTYSEGCLSVPGVYADVRRPARITVEYYDENLKKVTEDFDKFGCRMVQHELDHLDGHLFVEKVAPVRRKMIAKKLQNIARGKVSTRYKTK